MCSCRNTPPRSPWPSSVCSDATPRLVCGSNYRVARGMRPTLGCGSNYRVARGMRPTLGCGSNHGHRVASTRPGQDAACNGVHARGRVSRLHSCLTPHASRQLGMYLVVNMRQRTVQLFLRGMGLGKGSAHHVHKLRCPGI